MRQLCLVEPQARHGQRYLHFLANRYNAGSCQRRRIKGIVGGSWSVTDKVTPRYLNGLPRAQRQLKGCAIGRKGSDARRGFEAASPRAVSQTSSKPTKKLNHDRLTVH